jgi:hypothetical protein
LQLPQTLWQIGVEYLIGVGDDQGAMDGCLRYPAKGLSI